MTMNDPKDSDNNNPIELATVYYLEHLDTGRRLKWYKTLAGARIAQRARNHRLGFQTRLERLLTELGQEQELCLTQDGKESIATYVIVEDSIERVGDLYTY
jgi:hypothetical protein